MDLLIDVGNTEVKISIAANSNILKKYRLITDANLSSDAYYLQIKPFIEGYDIKRVAISSVVPSVTQALRDISSNYLNVKPLIIGPGIKTGINVKTDYPKEVGADLICASAGINTKDKPALIIDLGTATKYIYVENNTIKGVIITPGVMISMKALVSSTALLPQIDIEVPPKVLGTNTIACMQSGVTYGAAAQVDGLIKRVKDEVKKDFDVIMTGGLSAIITPLLETNVSFNTNLVLLGLLNILERNSIR
ncbi:MAG TPA: type III pantothenate kinase [Acholeplasma sp.]|nr:type III pantothenate kinase [Acholeplasma sp.]